MWICTKIACDDVQYSSIVRRDFWFSIHFIFFCLKFSLCSKSRLEWLLWFRCDERIMLHNFKWLHAMDFSELQTIDKVMNEFGAEHASIAQLLTLMTNLYYDSRCIHLHLAKRLKFYYYWKVQCTTTQRRCTLLLFGFGLGGEVVVDVDASMCMCLFHVRSA